MVKFDKEVIYVGRNGSGRQSGLEVELLGDRVILEPVNSKGKTANCTIAVPVCNLGEVITALQQLKAQHDAKGVAA
jgi:hypothetical protein